MCRSLGIDYYPSWRVANLLKKELAVRHLMAKGYPAHQRRPEKSSHLDMDSTLYGVPPDRRFLARAPGMRLGAGDEAVLAVVNRPQLHAWVRPLPQAMTRTPSRGVRPAGHQKWSEQVIITLFQGLRFQLQ